MEANHLHLTGQVVETGRVRVSPAGVPQVRFVIEHRSRQEEAGGAREARLRMYVKVAGEPLASMAAALEPGERVDVEGFLSRAGFRASEAQLVLNARRITRA